MNMIAEYALPMVRTPVDDSLLLWIVGRGSLGKSNTFAEDLSRYKRNGTIYGAVRQSSPAGHPILYLDGVDDRIELPAFPLSSPTNTLSFAFWSRTALLNQHQTFLGDASQSATAGYIFTYRELNTNNLCYQYATGSIWAYFTFYDYFLGWDNQWLHTVIVADYQNRVCKAYRNGQLFRVLTTTNTMLFPSANRVRYIGCYSPSYYFLRGNIDDIRIYNRELTPSEISRLYNATKHLYGR